MICLVCGSTDVVYTQCKYRCLNCGAIIDCSDPLFTMP